MLQSTHDQSLGSRNPNRHRILIVDDEPLIRWSLSETLRHTGYTVVEAGDARSAVAAASDEDNPFGVMVLDVRLPDSDGLSLLATMRRLHRDAKIIVMTAHGTAELEREARGMGAFSVMHKPFGIADFADLVDQASDDYASS